MQKKIFYIFLFFLLLSAVLTLYRNSSPVLFVGGIIQSVFSAPKSAMYALGKKERQDEMTKLTKANLALIHKMTDYQLLKNDNEALKSQFLSSGATSQKLIAAQIIGFKGNSSLPTEFIINSGKKEGLKIGMAVIYDKNLIGKIINVSNNYSVLVTAFDSTFQVLAKLPDTNANGLLIGKNDFMLLDQVVITDTLIKDGIILTKGEVNSDGIGVPPDLIIGKISSISKNETSPFQSAEVMPVIDFSKLTEVFVISQM